MMVMSSLSSLKQKLVNETLNFDCNFTALT